MTEKIQTGYFSLTSNVLVPGTVEPAWAPLIRDLTDRIKELERRDAVNATLIERLDQDITTLFIDMSMIRSGGNP